MFRHIVACVPCAALFAFPAAAQDRTFEGPSVTAIVGVDNSSVYGRDTTGLLYGGQIGYDVQRGNLVFGVEGELTGADSKKCFMFTSVAPVSAIRDCRKAGRDLYAGGRIGVVVGGTTLLYGKAGYTNARNNVDYSFTGTPPYAFKGDVTSDGVRVGLGAERIVSSNLSLKAEYRYSNYEGGYIRHQGVVGLSLRF